MKTLRILTALIVLSAVVGLRAQAQQNTGVMTTDSAAIRNQNLKDAPPPTTPPGQVVRAKKHAANANRKQAHKANKLENKAEKQERKAEKLHSKAAKMERKAFDKHDDKNEMDKNVLEPVKVE